MRHRGGRSENAHVSGKSIQDIALEGTEKLAKQNV